MSESPIAARAEQPEVEAVEDAVDELVEEAHGDPHALAEEEVHRLGARQPELGLDRRAALGDDDALRQGRLVEGEGVGALLGNSDGPLALGIRQHLGVVAIAAHRDAHALEGSLSYFTLPWKVKSYSVPISSP